MKKVFLIIITAVISVQFTYACDICGCGVGNNYLVVPQKRIEHNGINSL